MTAAHFAVTAVESCAEARKSLTSQPPDLILIALGDGLQGGTTFCQELRSNPLTQQIALVAVGGANTARARFAALDTGVDDVMPNPVSDSLLMSRIRALMRRRNAGADLELRDGTNGILGFEEELAAPLTPPRISVLSRQTGRAVLMVETLQRRFGHHVRLSALSGRVANPANGTIPDLIVIDGTPEVVHQAHLFHMICDLRARTDTRFSAIVVRLPEEERDLAALAMDLGADDIAFDEISEEEFLHRCHALVSLKTRQDRMRDRLRRGLKAALTDPLTGLSNRRQAEAQLRQVADRARSKGHDFAVLVLDIDHFKSVNDRHGHAAGDAVLRELSDRLRETFRESDLIARIGGEEFLVAIPECDKDFAVAAAERLRGRVNRSPFTLPAEAGTLKITVSVGVATSTAGGRKDGDIDALVARADAALYRAKHAGRDAVSLSAA